MRLGTALLGALAALLASAAAARSAELVVGSAVSLREPLLEIAERYEREPGAPRVRIAFGASSTLFAQIRAGAPLDVFLSADERLVDRLAAEGLIEPGSRFALAGNRLVAVATPERVGALRTAADLAGPALRRLALPPDAVPLGHYARSWLARRGLLEALEGRILVTEHARATLAAVAFGHADAALVYASDARAAPAVRVAFEIPEREQPRIVYHAARVRDARQGALADRFLAVLRDAPARAALVAAGFAEAPGGAAR